ncbi:hypothetical protein A0H81_14943 [Grifola frondosa]|uniref:C2H2-type domain-containing protein n=1 Tax=Grifola frondosa TaxID=5627 RepID=A0A1C7LQN3_GRIFR|nr:hypothetical protein A0H81_14943 [Grifola frondosa]
MLESSSVLSCDNCGQKFTLPNNFTTHQKRCTRGKKRLASALSKAREAIAGRKRRLVVGRDEAPQDLDAVSLNDQRALPVSDAVAPALDEALPSASKSLAATADCQNAIATYSLSLRLLSLPRFPKGSRLLSSHHRMWIVLAQEGSLPPPNHPLNAFGLSRTYYATSFPDHDPEDSFSLHDLSSSCFEPSSMHSDSTPPPPPQMSSIHIRTEAPSFWANGIVGDPVFHPSHIQHSSWDQINRILGQHECNDGQWFDEDDGWVKDSVTISVPFHSKTPSPGPINFSVDEFYHRSIVAVVKEKILNYQQDNFFHYEPFEVHWHREDHPEPVRVYGELYSSSAFLDAHLIDNLLKEESLVPVSNAFSDRLGPLGFDFHPMLVNDIMHEVELGVWKSVFIHLLRILDCISKDAVRELDRRFRVTPTFGRDTIRRFSSNCSELKQLAAHDYEDILQCSIPAFEGLLPEPHNKVLMDLLFVFAQWHGLAKLRMHTDETLELMDGVTADYETRESVREAASRRRRQARQQSQEKASSNPSHAAADSARRPKTLNLETFKYHALGDYTMTIRRYGTTDSYSTQPGELEHRTSKGRYRRTSRKHFVRQLTQIERRQARIRAIRNRYNRAADTPKEEIDNSPNEHYHMGKSQNHREVLGPFLLKNSDDPAVMNFLPKLRQHLLPRIQAKLREEDAVNAISDRNGTGVEDLNDAQVSEDQNCVLFKNDCIYRHYILRLNYMTYDVRRAQDVINPNTSHRDVMGLVEIEGEQHGIHPFWYARVLGIFHVDVVYTGSGMLDFRSRRMDFLWVRWFQVIDDVTINWSGLKMDLLRFVPMYDEDAFGFIDPADILRGCHIIPAYTHGQMHADGIGLSSIAQDASDAQKYYVNRFVDRDMIMRYYWGMAVGHTYARRSAVSSSTPSEAVEQDLTLFAAVVAVPEIAISDTVVVAPIVESSQDDQSAGLPSISTSDADLVTKQRMSLVEATDTDERPKSPWISSYPVNSVVFVHPKLRRPHFLNSAPWSRCLAACPAGETVTAVETLVVGTSTLLLTCSGRRTGEFATPQEAEVGAVIATESGLEEEADVPIPVIATTVEDASELSWWSSVGTAQVIVVVDIEEAESSSPASVRSIPTVESPEVVVEQHMDFEEKLESPVIATTEAGEGVAKSAFLSMVAVPEIPERPKSPWTRIVRMPGDVCRPEQWLLPDRIADEHGGTLKITTRQTSQFHGVIKRHLKAVIQDINHALLDTLAAYGDINRNVIVSALPSLSKLHN